MLSSRLSLVALLGVLLVSSAALAGDGSPAPDAPSFILDMVKSLGLPLAFLFVVGWYHVRKEAVWSVERADLINQIKELHKEAVLINRSNVEALNAGAETAKAWEKALLDAKGGGTGRRL